jgi:diguanylate cyclase (GGDEF)-like protein
MEAADSHDRDRRDTDWPGGLVSVEQGLVESLRRLLPRGGSLPMAEWQRRHSEILIFLWLNVLALPILGGTLGSLSFVHNLDNAAAVGLFAVLGATMRLSRKLRSLAASLGLLISCALFVHMAGGRIEAHFYFFVLIIVLTLYEDWTVFLVAVGFVLIHHGVIGTLNPHAVFDRPEEWANPWLWASIHAAFIAAAGVAAIVAWRLNESVRGEMRAAHRQLENVSETDSLTGMGNRRRLMVDLQHLITAEDSAVLVILDLDGFKSYNDTFGHPAGDALLARLGRHLSQASKASGHAYRLGGDEFCAIWRGPDLIRAQVEAAAAAPMRERGEGFVVSASYGSVALPAEASTIEEALRIADHRMYSRKHGTRRSQRSQSHDVLIQTLIERHPDLSPHIDAVTALAEGVAERLGLSPELIEQVRHAAELHDIGKVAIPDAIINKPGPLDEDEWEFIRRHTIIGERILRAAPALAPVATLVRSTHEHVDGKGYPDGLAGDQIPIGARIICVCDAYDAMTSNRPYRLAQDPRDALAELHRCAGHQFAPEVVAALEDALETPEFPVTPQPTQLPARS